MNGRHSGVELRGDHAPFLERPPARHFPGSVG